VQRKQKSNNKKNVRKVIKCIEASPRTAQYHTTKINELSPRRITHNFLEKGGAENNQRNS
jgi:hypothetical protein